MKHLRLYLLQAAAVLFLTICLNQAQAQVQTPRYISMGPNTNGYYEYLPQGYGTNSSQTYPLILFIHGMGELGDGSPGQLPKLLVTGIAASINVGEMPVSLTVNGQTFSFIAISPQFVNWPSPTDINNVLDYVVSHYRVDINRIYLTGLSMGGGAVWEYAGNNSTYANRVAAIVPIAGASWPDYGRSRTIASANLPVWALHNNYDPTCPVSYTNTYVSQINEAPAPNPLARKTIFEAYAHDAWTEVYNSHYKENNQTVYQWMLQYARGGVVPPNTNKPPTANAGPTQTVNGTTAQLSGSGTDPDGTIASYNWTKLSGPTGGNITSPSSPSTGLTGLIGGSYKYRLTVTDNSGATGTSDVVINVIASIPGRIEAENYTAMSGIQTENTGDPGGGLDVGWQENNDWMDYNVNVTTAGTYAVNFRVATPNTGVQFQLRKADGSVLATVTAPNTGAWQSYQNVIANVDLAAGQQTLRIVTTDAKASGWNFNWMDFSQSSATPNKLPTVSAGAAQTITLPASTASLTGNATDSDGTIASYAWSEVSGPNNAVFSNASAAS
ncbi:MAG TPA: carbohydrate-binding protein, partial [Flavisolibacter sp.]|nr:carbohydrate-binding protein [Flavisolibacter sp.]